MALSANADRALEQVKMGLFMLYGADYFTEDEWVKIDGLIHKGKYVFTRGPPTNFIEDELMSFDEAKESNTSPTMRGDPSDTFGGLEAKMETVKTTEESGASPSSEELNESDPPSTTVSAHITSTEGSLNGAPEMEAREEKEEVEFDLSSELTMPPPIAQRETEQIEQQSEFECEHDIVQQGSEQYPEHMPEPQKDEEQIVEETKPKPAPKSAIGGFALGYTQEQLDEIKAFNTGLTRSGKRGNPKREDSIGSQRDTYPSENGTLEEQQDYPSPTSRDVEDNHIQNWASGVDNQTQISAPDPSTEPKLALVEKFLKMHGRAPRNLNDIYQPNNNNFVPLTKRSVSHTSNKVAKSTGSTAVAINNVTIPKVPQLKVDSGTVLIAQSSSPSTNRLRIDIEAGDQVKVLKHVSGIIHYGKNLRTQKAGQFIESIFRKPTGAELTTHQHNLALQKLKVQKVYEAERQLRASNGIDDVERVNASQWDEVPSLPKPRIVSPVSVRPLSGGLANSRFAAFSEMDSKSEDSQDFVHGLNAEYVAKLVDQKLGEILGKGAQIATPTSSTPSRPRWQKEKIKDPLEPIEPKKSTCWFWATPNKDCRFTADECRDLHAFVDTSSKANLRMGKPTWGAAADSSTPPLPYDRSDQLSSHLSNPGFTPVSSGLANYKRAMTCHFWANEGKCQYSAEKCKYLHEFGGNGVAARPKWGQSKLQDWNRWETVDRNKGSGGWGSGEAPGNSSSDARNSCDDTGITANLAPAWEVEESTSPLVLEEVKNANEFMAPTITALGSSNNTWGVETQADDYADANENEAAVGAWGDNKGDQNLPAHVKALEEKTLIENIGW